MGNNEKLFPFNCVQLECKDLALYAKLISLTNKHCFSSPIYGTPNYDQSETFGVAFDLLLCRLTTLRFSLNLAFTETCYNDVN